VFCAKEKFDFYRPSNFCRSASFLRTCRQVYLEGCSILYGENSFYFERSKFCRNNIWSNCSKEVGYKDIRRFLTMIGPMNLAHLREIHIVYEDICRGHSQYLSSEERRYVHDPHLIACLKILARQTFLKSLVFIFGGKKDLATTDRHFLEYLCDLRADNLEIKPYGFYPVGYRVESRVRALLRAEIMRERPLYGLKEEDDD
jgi:hypothetical protein